MTVAIVHYHMGIGGVSNVIQAASRCLTKLNIKHVILCDDPPDENLADYPIWRVEGLGYHRSGQQPDTDLLRRRLRDVAKEALGEAPSVWHFHNHSLGKHAVISEVIARMAEARERMVLQIHDLAEDGRPENYALIQDTARLYPVADNIRYVFLNERDRKIFMDHGMKQEAARLMVNPVPIPEQAEPLPTGDPILFAPMRAIRRKNVGEMVFLAGLAPRGVRIAVSRGPLGTRRQIIHETWKKFAAHMRLPIGFDVVDQYNPVAGAKSDFQSWIKHSTHFISTSVAEGFGLPFLEAAAHGRPLIGRSIDYITAEHERNGIKVGHLYDQLLIPLDWVDISMMRQHFDTTMERNYRYYGRILPKHIAEETFRCLNKEGWLDFGDLAEPLQQGVVERLGYPEAKTIPQVVINGEKRSARTWFAEVIENRKPMLKAADLKLYTEETYAQTLKELYDELHQAAKSKPRFLDPRIILDAHLAPKRFKYLCSAIPPRSAVWSKYKAVIFDIYGTLLISPAGGVKPDPTLDSLMNNVLHRFGYDGIESPSQALYDAVQQHHQASDKQYPEVDLRVLWREILSLAENSDVTALVVAMESECRPSQPMPGAAAFIRRLAHSGVSLGILSNGQCNTLRSLGGLQEFFSPELILVSYLHGMAKPAPELFQLMADRLACRGIKAEDTLYVGNDPLLDIMPAAACGFKTALFTGHPESVRDGVCMPDHEITTWNGAALNR